VNHKPCKCGCRPTGVIREGRAMYRVVCMCGRSGPFADTINGSWAAWDADHEAAAKAREALHEIVSWTKDTQTCANEDAMWKRAAESLALLGEEDHAA